MDFEKLSLIDLLGALPDGATITKLPGVGTWAWSIKCPGWECQSNDLHGSLARWVGQMVDLGVEEMRSRLEKVGREE